VTVCLPIFANGLFLGGSHSDPAQDFDFVSKIEFFRKQNKLPNNKADDKNENNQRFFHIKIAENLNEYNKISFNHAEQLQGLCLPGAAP